jgi:YbgC/YbaW family acyl-CoA thioester hydrolase
MFTTSFTIEWGDCDEAGIVFYPNYFYWFDCAFQRLLRDRGLSQRELRKRFGAVTPIVEAHSDFKAPARYDDVLDIEITVKRAGERRFRVDYRFSSKARLVGTGYEVRAWAQLKDDGTIKSAPLSEEFMSMLDAAAHNPGQRP